jgi:long-chain acyl-CoA synthetase
MTPILNIACTLTDTARHLPTQQALVGVGSPMTYAELDAASDRAADLLRSANVSRGDRVALVIPNVPQAVIALYGALKAGCTALPLNPLLTSGEIFRVLVHSQARAAIVDETCTVGALPAIADAEVKFVWTCGGPGIEGTWHFESQVADATRATTAATAPSDPAVLLYTSGTTGTPKAVTITHANLLASSVAWQRAFAYGPRDRVLAAVPLSFSLGLVALLSTSVFAGSTLVLSPERFDPGGVLDLVGRESVTILLGVPTMHAGLVAASAAADTRIDSVRIAGGGGANLPVPIADGLADRFGCFVGQGYGLTETTALLSLPSEDLRTDPRGVGVPAWGVQVRAIDPESGIEVPGGEVGELTMRGPSVMAGYWDDPGATASAIDPEGWFHTGDLGRIDETGQIYLVDRLKELIIRGGVNVYPSEIEAVLSQHPNVRLAAVLGVPDERLGEEVAAAVIPKQPGLDPDELREWARGRIAAQKYPRRISVVDELPLAPTGKVLKKALDVDTLFQTP